ncbi:MAG: hypothetical protein KGL39_07920 [Patescibacteria group bacterium]|nr:hypothetical protein [Patescibacteria group bacterium]
MPAQWERCVNDVKAKGGAANPYAVCTKSTGLTRTGKRLAAPPEIIAMARQRAERLGRGSRNG